MHYCILFIIRAEFVWYSTVMIFEKVAYTLWRERSECQHCPHFSWILIMYIANIKIVLCFDSDTCFPNSFMIVRGTTYALKII